MNASPWIWLTLLGTLCFSLATQLHLWYQGWSGNRAQANDVLSVLLGDSRRMFANHFFVKADVSLHGGYYPSLFDQAQMPKQLHVAKEENPAEHADHEEHDDLPEFLAKPGNWIERFGRNFYPAEHRHLDEAKQGKELLPWLLFSAQLDPHRIETYTVTAYWLRAHLGKADEAEQFLRAGLRANPDSAELLFELGRIYSDQRQDKDRARNLWEAALRKWHLQFGGKPEPDTILFSTIVTHLARLEQGAGRFEQAIGYLKMLQSVSLQPQLIQQQIDELRSNFIPRSH